MKIDLHVHTQDRSPCGRSPEEAQIQAAIAAGLDAIYFTDHSRLCPPARLAELNRRYAPFRIFNGIEVYADDEDFLVLGLPDPALEREEWSYPALHAHVRAGGGFLALAHPFRYRASIAAPIQHYRPDAIEMYSHNTPAAAETEIRSLAARLGLILLSNSDAHGSERLGSYYNVLPNAVFYTAGAADEQAVLACLRAGELKLFKP